MTRTRFGVVMAARDEERYIVAQLAAIQTQAIRPDEIVIVDDGSVDGTREIVQSFCLAVPEARLIPLSESVGAIAAQNIAVDACECDWLYDASANDIVQPGAFRAFARAVSRHPDSVLVTGDVVGSTLAWAQDVAAFSPTEVAGLLGARGIVHGAATFVRRDAWHEVGGMLRAVDAYADALLWHVLACRYGLTYVAHPMAWVRPGHHWGGMCLDRDVRRPYLEAFAEYVLRLEEPTRSRLLGSGLWSIQEFAPDMGAILREKLMVA